MTDNEKIDEFNKLFLEFDKEFEDRLKRTNEYSLTKIKDVDGYLSSCNIPSLLNIYRFYKKYIEDDGVLEEINTIENE